MAENLNKDHGHPNDKRFHGHITENVCRIEIHNMMWWT